jgi:hypothetical protein
MTPEPQKKSKRTVCSWLNLLLVLAVLLTPGSAVLSAGQSITANNNQCYGGSSVNYQIQLSPNSIVQAPTINVNWASYHNYAALVSLLLQLNQSYPNLVYVFSIGKTWQNRTIFCIKITNQSIDNSGKQQILIVAEHHAREVITQEAALYFVCYLLTNYGTDFNVRKLLASKEIYIVPCLNPDGMEVALTYNPFQRKNMHPIDDDGDGTADEDIIKDMDHDGHLDCYEIDKNVGTNQAPSWMILDQAYEGNATGGHGVVSGYVGDNPGGVDLNRNYGFHFNDTFELSSNVTNPRVEDYKGPAPFSEPETRAVRDLVESHRFVFAFSLHSGTEALLRPWAYTTDVTSLGANYTLFNMLGGVLSQQSGYSYSVGVGNIGYNCSGEFADWMYGVKGIPTMTCEIYGNYSAYQYRNISPSGDTYVWWGVWSYFNPPVWMIEQVCLRSLKMLLQVSSVNLLSSFRTTSSSQQPIVFGDGLDSLNITWTFGGTTDTAIASYAFLPFESWSRYQFTPIGNVFSISSNRSAHGFSMVLKYSDYQLNSTNTRKSDLEVLTWDTQTHEWAKLEPSGKNDQSGTITVELTADMPSDTPYYFILASYSYNAPQMAAILFLAFASGAIATIVIALVVSRKGREGQNRGVS